MARRPHQNRPPDHRNRFTALAVCGFLLLAVGLVFGQTIHHEFVNYDDHQYVYDNSHIVHGQTVEKIAWAFTNCHAANWHPLTWLSHILDFQLYGLQAGGHHATSALLHAVTAILLFLVLWRMTRDLWPSAFAAAIFAIHPLRVESVAWAAERKDVLSGLFFMLTLWAYLGYVRRPFSLVRYLAVVALFALGLMAKPMLVTLPLVLLLLDYWPLGRMGTKPRPACWGGSCTATPEATVQLSPQQSVKPRPVVAVRDATAGRGFMASVWFLVLEKIPLFVLATASCVATILAQGQAVVGLNVVPLSARIFNAPVSYVAYLGQFFYPAGLAALYPHPGPDLPIWKPIASLVALTAISIAVLIWRRRCPSMLVGWFWYLGMLVPVIGLVQVGAQAMADRYTYLPQIGLCIALSWGTMHVVRSWSHRGRVCGAGSALVLAMLMACAWRQTTFWRNSEILWTHTIECTSRNAMAYNNLGGTLARNGRFGEAIARYQKALEMDPNYADAHSGLADALAGDGRVDEAIVEYQKALKITPDLAEVHNNLGHALAGRGRVDEAIAHYQQAVEIKRDYAEAHNNLASALLRRGRVDEAIAHCRKALEIRPDYADALFHLASALAGRGEMDEAIAHYQKGLKFQPNDADAHNNLGLIFAGRGRVDEAIAEYQTALKLLPDNAEAHYNFGLALANRGRLDEAIVAYRKALEIRPDFADAHNNLGAVLEQQGRSAEAIAQYQAAMKANPDYPDAYNNLAWVRATSGEASIRNGKEAVELAQRAVRLSGGRSPNYLDTLAAAYAEAGRFSEAVQTARKALDLAVQQPSLADALRAKIALYKAGKPLRQTLPVPSTPPAKAKASQQAR